MIGPPQTTTYPVGTDTTSGNRGGPNALLVLRDGTGPYNGRWVVGQHWQETSSAPSHCRAAYSLDGGYTWHNSVDPTKAVNPAYSTTLVTENIVWTIASPSGGPWYIGTPSLAVDPNDPSKVYMAFMAHRSSESSGAHFYIARSTDGGVNFSGDLNNNQVEGQRVLRLTDSDLGGSSQAGSIQFLPSITVDQWGRVHVLYYTGRYDSTAGYWKYRVRLASIPTFSTYPHPATVLNTEITDYEFNLEHSSVWRAGGGGVRIIGDYMNTADTRGCQFYGGYIAPPSTGGVCAVYVAMVLIANSECVPDAGCYANCDGSTTAPVLNALDFLCYLERFAAGDSYANCDASTTPPVLNVNDLMCFLNRYSAGCS